MANVGEVVSVSSLSSNEQKIVKAALEVKDNAHCPYSNFNVGAALISGTGEIYKGCNVENAAYPLSTCAERTAIVKAVSEGEKSISSIAVVATSGDGKDVGFVAPCGGCRQIIYEFGHSTNCTVLMVENSGKECRKMAIKDLLPGAFGPDALLNN